MFPLITAVKMGFLKHIRSRSKIHQQQQDDEPKAAIYDSPGVSVRGSLDHDPTVALPDAVLARIFALVCPHAQDGSYDSSEETGATGDGCMLCNLLSLSNCAKVNRKWAGVAQGIL